MSLVIHEDLLEVRLAGASAPHDQAKSYGVEIRALLDRVWGVIRTRKLSHKGINWVAYDADCGIFAGVELEIEDPGEVGLESRIVRFDSYAVWKHVGPYDRLGEAYSAMKHEIAARRLTGGRPFIERYGHWTDDVSKLETDLICPVASIAGGDATVASG